MSAYWKDVLREIKNTKGRFFSLLIIAALGSASVVGIQATSIDMRAVADKTYKETNLYDIQLKSTVGFDDDDLDALQGIPGVEAIMPTYLFDVYAYFPEATYSVRTYALPDSLNRIELIEGRLPQSANECAVERRFLNMGGYAIGDTISLGLDDMDDYAEILAESEMTIVGVVSSPLYINLHERGQTALGNGRLDLYLYLHEDAYLFDIYTDIYIGMQESQSMDHLSDDYDQAAVKWRDQIKPVGESRVQIREEELLDVRIEIDDGYIEYYDGLAELEERLAEGRDELADAKSKLDEAKIELEDGQRELDESIASGLAEIESNAADLRRAQRELDSHKAELEEASAQINEMRRQLEETLAGLALMGPYGVSSELNFHYEQAFGAIQMLDYQEAELVAGQFAIDASQSALDEGFRQIDAAYATLEEERLSAQADIDEGYQEYYDGLQEYEDGIAELEKEEADARADLAEAWLDLADAEAKLADAPTPEWFYFTRKDGVAFDSYYQDTLRLERIGYVFPLVFFLVAILVSLTTMTRMIEEHRTQIGVYKALGYRGVRMVTKYLIYAVSAGTVGGFIGVAGGSVVFPLIISDAYGHLYDMPPVDTPIPLFIGTVAVIAAVGSVALVTLFTCLATALAVPAELMRPKPPRAGKRVMLERIPLLWNRMGFIGKVTARNIFRYKRRFLMTLIGVAGCSALLLTAFGLRDSIGGVSEQQFGRIINYDAIAYLKELTDEEPRAELDAILEGSGSLYVREESVKAMSSGEELDVSIIVPENTDAVGAFINLVSLETNEAIPLSSTGVVVTEKLAEKLGLEAGGSIAISMDGAPYNLSVAEVTENYLLNYIYMSPDLYAETFDAEVLFNAVLILSGDTDGLASRLLSDDNVRAFISTEDQKESVADSTDALGIVTVVLIVLACSLALVVLFNLTNINISERIRELATIKVLGFYDSEIALYIYRENIAVTLMGILLGLWGGMFLHGFILVTVEVDILMFPRIIHTSSYLLAAFLSAAFAVCVNLVMNVRLSSINMVESLKNVE